MKKNLIEISDEVFISIYKRFPVIFDHGDGIYLYDTDGKEYLDFASGIGVMALGYNNTKYNEELKAQIYKLLHTSNYYYNEPIIKAAKAVTDASGLAECSLRIQELKHWRGALRLQENMHILKTVQLIMIL